MPEQTNIEQFNMDIISAANQLRPDKPEMMESRQLIPFFQGLGMTDEGIVPGGLRDYTTEVLSILGLSPTIENLKTILELPEVQTTLKSAIAAANRVYETQKNTSMPDMSNIQGISEDNMKKLVQMAEAEQATVNAQTFAEKLEPESEPEPKAEETPKEEEKPSPFKKEEDPPVLCPRCGWRTNTPYKPYKVSEEDKMQFVYSIMQRVPFKKTFGLFDNQMKVTFRTKTTEDDAIIMSQLKRDLAEEIYGDPSSITFYSNLYELSLILVDIQGPVPDDTKAFIKPDYKDYAEQKNGLREYSKAVTSQYIGTEALLRLISEHYRAFTDMYRALVDEAITENFYNPA
ncbi:MAG: hypothetical protein IJF84_00515 [Thermoguttaceae bacterium]|nr:hypothetical protein [Thermoguttaceae bacterium]